MAIEISSRTQAPARLPQEPTSRRSMLVALPALNEEKTIESVISAIPRDLPGIATVDVLVVDDGSEDATQQLAEGAGAAVICHESTQGVGAAFQAALAYGIDRGYDLLVTIDADGQFDPRDIPKLVDPVTSGDADFTTASRFKDPDLVPRMPWIKRWGNRMMSRLISRLTGHTFYDVSCGMRCYSRRAALRLHLMGRFTYTQEVFLNLAFKKMVIREIPLHVRGERAHGKSRVARNLWSYALQTSQIIFRCYRDYHPLPFFGQIALLLSLPGTALAIFFLHHYVKTGTFTPHLWAGFTSAALFALGLLCLHIGMIGDILNRHRIYLEELLYEQRKNRRHSNTARLE